MIIVQLSRSELEAKRACPDGLALFDAIKRHQDETRARAGKPARRTLSVRWSRLAQVWAASAYPQFTSWLYEQGLIQAANLRGANLSSADLSSADLRCANLRGADLSSADLSSADLRGADLSGADLSGADLSSADLSSAKSCTCCPLALADGWERDEHGTVRRKAAS